MRRALVWLVLAAQLLVLAPAAQAQEQAEIPLPPAVEALAALPGSPRAALQLAFYEQLVQQGILPREATMAAQAPPPRPPGLLFRDARSACDMDGDGVEDLVSNDLALGAPPRLGDADARIVALSGADGSELWKVDNLVYGAIQPPPNVRLARSGAAEPGHPDNAQTVADVDGDGVCDVFAYGMDDGTGIVGEPLFRSASVGTFRVVAKLVSGKDGSEVWSMPIEGRIASATQDPLFGFATVLSIEGFPTGFLAFGTPEGPRVLVKTTDVRYVYANEPIWPGLQPPLPPTLKAPLRGSPWYETIRIDDHLQLLDGKDGKLQWSRDLRQPTDAATTNLTWISGVGDLDGDGSPDVLLDQYTLSDPRGSEADDPTTGKPLFRYGRGASLHAFSGKDGATLWSRVLVDPEAARANPPVEENHETVIWTQGMVGPDLDGDGRREAIASFVVMEESLGGTPNGLVRTRFVAVSGGNGTQLWDVRQQGWGVLRPAGATPETQRFLAMGMVDVPSRPPAGSRFPPKFVRMGVLDGLDGSTAWSYERSFAQNSFLSYNLALSQYEDALAPIDLDRDGFLDLVTPAQHAPATGRDQVLLATSSHSYEVRSGLDGAVLSTLRLWGPDGRLLPCVGDGSTLTFLTGHARRLDVTRVDAASGATVWRRPVFNAPEPHAASAGVDVLALGAACADRSDGTLAFSANVDAYSAARGMEVVPEVGVLRADGSPAWILPEVRGQPSVDEDLFRASVRAAQAREAASPWPGVAVGSVLGALCAVGTAAALRGRGSALAKMLGAGLALLVLVAPLVVALPAPAPVAGLVGLPSGGAAPGPAQVVEAARGALAGLGHQGAASASHLDANDTISFTYDAGDLDGDGVEDVLLDHYCADFLLCWPFGDLLDPFSLVGALTSTTCSPSHHLIAVSGADHSVLLDVDLDVPTIIFDACGESFFLGVVPMKDGSKAALVYKYVTYYDAIVEYRFTHDFILYDLKTGEPRWTYHDTGHWITDVNAFRTASNVILNPVLHAGPEPALFLQGVGFTETGESTWPAPVSVLGMNRDVSLWDAHYPQEWAARIDVETGQAVWRVDTFRETDRSVLPELEAPPSLLGAYGPDDVVSERYWTPRACCGDLTGDGVPDLAFRTLEWNPVTAANVQGPYFADSRFVVFDGASGERRVDTFVTRDIDAPISDRIDPIWTLGQAGLRRPAYRLWHEPLGGGLLLRHEAFGGAPYRHNVAVVDGAGEVLWTRNSTRDLRAAALGDADGDGVPDVLTFDWFSHDGTNRKQDAWATPADVPLRLLSGRDGHEIWSVTTFMAPIDVAVLFQSMLVNGPIDVDGDACDASSSSAAACGADGVLDVFTDDPEYLGDQTVIHHVTLRSGRDARPLWTADAVGAFAMPTRIADVDGDGRDDVALVSGDVNDLWVTVHRGSDGGPIWSRRVLALPASGYAEAIPRARFHVLHGPDGAPRDILDDFHVEVTASYFSNGLCIGCDDADSVAANEWSGRYTFTLSQILAMDATLGRGTWAVPQLGGEVDAFVAGGTPGTQMYHRVLEEASPLSAASDAAPRVLPGAAAFGAVYVAGLGVAAAVLRYARRFEGVPDLE